jgi:ankyrin repeat protein
MLLLNAVEGSEPPQDTRLVELLLQRGAPLEEVDDDGDTALLLAVMRNDLEVGRCRRKDGG